MGSCPLLQVGHFVVVVITWFEQVIMFLPGWATASIALSGNWSVATCIALSGNWSVATCIALSGSWSVATCIALSGNWSVATCLAPCSYELHARCNLQGRWRGGWGGECEQRVGLADPGGWGGGGGPASGVGVRSAAGNGASGVVVTHLLDPCLRHGVVTCVFFRAFVLQRRWR